jgi:serine/alanine adding enzyme
MVPVSSISVEQVESSTDGLVWDNYVNAHPHATGYHLMAWRHVITAAVGHSVYYYLARDSQGTVRGILPLVYLNSRMFGRFLVSLPYFNYGGLLADNAEAKAALLGHATACACSLGATHIELRHTEAVDILWARKDHKVSMRLDLPQRFEDLMRAFPPKLRSQVRRGEKEGMYARTGSLELLDDFYGVFSRNMRDLGTPVYGKEFFKEVLNTFPKDACVCCVYLQDQVLAAGFLYGFRKIMEIPWAASDRRYARMAPNMMLYGSVLRYACEQGYRVFDFGRSTKDSGTYRFKEQWGAKPVQLHWHYWLCDGGPLPELNPQNPKYALAIRVWQHLPVPMATFIGPRVAKYLP